MSVSDAVLDVASLSHPGMVRSHNEDTVFVDGDAGIAVLADGMGGYNAGEVASGIAVNTVTNGMMPELRSGRELSKVDVKSGLTHGALLLQQQIAAANKGIYEAAQARPLRARGLLRAGRRGVSCSAGNCDGRGPRAGLGRRRGRGDRP